MNTAKNNRIRQIIALGGIVLVGGFLLVALSGFIPALLGSIIFYVICSPFVRFLIDKVKFKKSLAVSFTLILSFLVILVPVFFLTYSLIFKISTMFSGSQNLYSDMQHLSDYINTRFGINILSDENLIKLQSEITSYIPNLFSQTISILADIAIMYFVLFYLLHTETSIEKSIVRFLPYKKENAHLFTKELISETFSNVIGAPLLALIQGCFATLGFWVFGLNEPIFWGLMCGFLSFIPFVGSALVWLPAGIITMASGAYWHGTGILIYGIVVIVNVDNVFRLILQKKIGNIHPIVTVFGVIVGLKWFGVPGVIFGPLLISYLLIMVKIYRWEYGDKNLVPLDTDDNVEMKVDRPSENIEL